MPANRDWKSPRACAMINALHEKGGTAFAAIPFGFQSLCDAEGNKLHAIIKKNARVQKRKETPMPCTTILAGRKATHDGSTIIAGNDDG